MSVAGKVALITGGTGGLGKAFAKALLKGKASVVCLVDIAKNGSDVAADLNKQYSGSKVDYAHCDVTDYDKFKDVFDKLERDYGGVDIVCNNAGIQSYDHDVEHSKKGFRINLEAVFWGTKLGTDYMDKDRKKGGGVIVNIASMAGFLPIADSIVYTATKHGVIGLVRSASLSYKYTGVRINALCPSFTDTPILDKVPGTREMIAQIPGHRILDPDFVAQGFMQLVEDETLNGEIMRITPQKGIDLYQYKKRPTFRAGPPKL